MLFAKCTTTEGTDTNGGDGSKLVHGETTHRILACAYRVHSKLGPGLLENAYRACLCHEWTRLQVPFEREKTLPVIYDGVRVELGYRIDLIVNDVVIVEVKAVERILPVHEAQLLSYMRLSGKRVGLLINFNVRHLRQGIHRRILGY